MRDCMLTFKPSSDAGPTEGAGATTHGGRPCAGHAASTPSGRRCTSKISAKISPFKPSPANTPATRTARYFTGARLHGRLMCAWLINVFHLLIVLFLCAWVLLKGHPAAAGSTYRCEKDFWSNVFLTFVFSFMFDVVALDPFFIAAIYTFYAAYNRRQHDDALRRSLNGASTDLSDREQKSEKSENAAPHTEHRQPGATTNRKSSFEDCANARQHELFTTEI